MRKIYLNTLLTVVIFYFTALVSDIAFADMVYLKNGERVEGFIKNENQNQIILDIGSGKVIFDKNDIARIERYDAQRQSNLRRKWEYKYFSQLEYIPDSLKDTIKYFKLLEELREKAIENKTEKDAALEEINRIEDRIKKTTGNLAKVSQELSTFDSQSNIDKYNSLVEEFYSLQAKLSLDKGNKSSLKNQEVILDKNISSYISELSLFHKKLTQKLNLTKLSEEEKRFLKILRGKIQDMNNDFTKYAVSYGKLNSGILINVVLNNSIRAKLILDTGASLVIISKNIANKLGLEIDDASSMSIILADGRKAEAIPIVLKSIKVGNAEAINVRAAILEYKETVVEDGLLGMAFLENFIVKIEPKSGKLILEEFNP